MKRYTPEHEWIDAGSDGSYRIGITNYAQEQLGDVVTVELPEAGLQVTAGDACAVIESVKSASDIFAPITGTITSVNEPLVDSPELVNEDAEGKGWLFEIKAESEPELDKLMDLASYESSVS